MKKKATLFCVIVLVLLVFSPHHMTDASTAGEDKVTIEQQISLEYDVVSVTKYFPRGVGSIPETIEHQLFDESSQVSYTIVLSIESLEQTVDGYSVVYAE